LRSPGSKLERRPAVGWEMPSGHHRRLHWIVGASLLVALVAAVLSVSRVSLLPPTIEPRQIESGTATTHFVIDSPLRGSMPSMLFPQHAEGVAKRADLLSEMIATPPVLSRIARRLGVSQDEVGAVSRSTAGVPLALSEPASEERATEILASGKQYRLDIQARHGAPVVDVYAQAPSKRDAERLADAAVSSLRDYLAELERQTAYPGGSYPGLYRQGRAHGAVANAGAATATAVLTFLVVLVVALLAGLFATRTPPARTAASLDEDDDLWPHTTRLLPWMLAAFLAILWLVPFNSIELSASLPIDLKFDRLILPFIGALWIFALIAGGRGAPRMTATWIHAAVGAFLLWAFLSVVLNLRALDHTLEFDQTLKRLPLLLAYSSLFFMASSVVRKRELRAFLTYTLGLAAICSIGIIWEYRYKYNVFYDLSDKLLPGTFTVGKAEAAGIDGIGRRVVRGPGAVPLEAVAMLAMAFPIALVGAMQGGPWRRRMLHALIACIMAAAMVATYRKSALLAPASVILTLAYFRRRELLKLAPLGLVALVVVHALSPAALGSTVSQLDPSKLGVATVSERTIDYDAIRPDVWTHLAFGRGWGTYDHVAYRILDSEILQRLIETGVIGLLLYLLMPVAVVLTARRTIAARDTMWSSAALVGAAAAVSFIVVSALFDVMSFPHVPYIFLYLAGFAAVAVTARSERERSAPQRTTQPHQARKAASESASEPIRPLLPEITRV
jgi:hypothetical protein